MIYSLIQAMRRMWVTKVLIFPIIDDIPVLDLFLKTPYPLLPDQIDHQSKVRGIYFF
jgi:hypothetical protein